MLDRLEIRGFRGIKNGVLDQLAQVNILIGRNGSGKSTVLESINILATPYFRTDVLGEDRLQRISSHRNENVYANGWWFGRDSKSPIVLKGSFGRFQAGIAISKSGPQEGNAGMKVDPPTISPTAVGQEEAATYYQKMLFIDAERALQKKIEQKLWGQVFLAGDHVELIELFEKIYGLKVRNVSFVNDELLVDIPPRPLRLDDLGAGMRISFRILLAESASGGSALFLEEFDAYQHKAGLAKLAEALCHISKRLNVQLFMTTHSLESVHAFVDAAGAVDDTLVKVFPLVLSSDGNLKTHGISSKEALELLKSGLDLREITSYAK